MDPSTESRVPGWLLAAVTLALGTLCICTIVEPDTGWYLRAGAEILARHAIPRFDPFSYTSTRPWLNHEWLAEVLLTLAERAGGLAGVGAFTGLCAAASVTLLAGVSGRAGRAGAWVAWCVALLIVRESANPRAAVMAWCLFSLDVAFALRARAETEREGGSGSGNGWLVALALVELVRAQIHGGNPDGVIVCGILAVTTRRPVWFAWTGLLAGLTCAGPFGWHVHEHFFGARGDLPSIREWQPLTVALHAGSGQAWACVALGVAGLVALGWRWRRGDGSPFETLLFLVFTAAALRYIRFSAQWAIVSALVSGPAFDAALARLTDRRWLGPLLAGATLATGLALSGRDAGTGFSTSTAPADAVRFLQRERPRGPMLNAYNFGGYLLWAYPDERVFIDGRAFTVYEPSQLRTLVSVYERPARFQVLDARHHFGFAILQSHGRSAALVTYLASRPDWRVAYRDPLATVLVRRAPSAP